MPVLEITDLSVDLSIKGSWIPALNDVSLTLERGEVLGKTERELNRLRTRSVAMVFQNPTSFLNPVLRVGDQIAEIFDLSPELLDVGARRSKRERRREAWRRSIE